MEWAEGEVRIGHDGLRGFLRGASAEAKGARKLGGVRRVVGGVRRQAVHAVREDEVRRLKG